MITEAAIRETIIDALRRMDDIAGCFDPAQLGLRAAAGTLIVVPYEGEAARVRIQVEIPGPNENDNDD